MPGEKRLCQRWPVSIDVLIHENTGIPDNLLRFKSDNVSQTGMFINTNGIRFPLHHMIMLIIPPQSKEVSNSHIMRARVMRNEEHGIGISFIDPRPSTIQLFRALFSESGN